MNRNFDLYIIFKCYRIFQHERYVSSQTRWIINLTHQAKNTLISWNHGCKSWQNHLSVYPFLLCGLKTAHFIVFSSLGWDLNDWDLIWYMWPLHSITTFRNSRNLPDHFRQNFVLHDVLFTNCPLRSTLHYLSIRGMPLWRHASHWMTLSFWSSQHTFLKGSHLPEGHVKLEGIRTAMFLSFSDSFAINGFIILTYCCYYIIDVFPKGSPE